MDFGLDPVQGKRHQPYRTVRVEALDGLHQANVAFLDQVGMRQAIAQILAGHRHHQPQMGGHQLAGSIDVLMLLEPARQTGLLLGRQHRQAIDGRDVGVQIAQ